MVIQRIKAGIVQFDIRLGDVDRNLALAKKRIAFLAGKGAQLVVLPEMWSTGFANKGLNELSKTTPGILSDLSAVAKRHRLAVIGSLPEKRRDGMHNTAYVVDRDGTVTGAYRKVHLFSPTGEHRHFKPGRRAVVAETTLGPIGLIICYDLRFPELCRSLTFKGARIVIVTAQWPAIRVTHWHTLLVARAIENQLFVLGANRCGEDGDLVFGGHSRIVSPYGEILARAGKRPAALFATLNMKQVESYREQIPALKERMPQAYE